MWRASRQVPTVPVAIGLVLALLATLATLQYRWAGDLSEAERTRLRAAARSRAEAMARDFDGEITRVFRQLEMSGETRRSGDFEPWAQHYDAWHSAATWPRLVQAVYLVEAQPNPPEIKRYLPERRTFSLGEWPAELAPFRQQIETGGHERGSRRPFFDRILEEVPALVLITFDHARRDLPPAGAPPRPSRPPFWPGFLLVVLDSSVIRNEVLPALAERHFGAADGLDQDLEIVRQSDPPSVVWSSRPGSPPWTSTDAAAGLFEIRNDDGPGPHRGGPGFRGPRAYGEDSGHWRLRVANHAGPLDEVVATARRRNLTVSFGILLLLVTTMSLVVISADRARRLGERKMQFVAAVSHELRTPVSVIHSTSENLADGVVTDPAQVRAYGTVIRDESRRLAGMIEDVLEFAGASSTRRTHRQDTVSVVGIVDGALAALETALRDGGFTVVREVDGDLPCLRGDAALLRHALQNLVENALKYDGGNRWMAVRANADLARKEVVLTVEDHGKGIPARDLPNVFEPFYRGQDAQERQIHGFGLGLALVKRAVEDHGGRVAVESTEGQGARFTVRLPAAAPTPATSEGDATDDALSNPAR